MTQTSSFRHLMTPTGNPAKVFKLFLDEALTLVYSKGILFEYVDVLYRAKLQLNVHDVEAVLNAIQRCGQFVIPSPSLIPMPDEDDRMFYGAAKLANAHLVTGNARHYPPESWILSPTEFLEL